MCMKDGWIDKDDLSVHLLNRSFIHSCTLSSDEQDLNPFYSMLTRAVCC